MENLLKMLKDQIESGEQKYRNVRLSPKVLETKKNFTPQEKNHLTRKGFYWYLYYDFKNPTTGKFERQKTIKNRINQRYPDFDQRLIELKKMRKAFLEVLKGGYNPYETKEDRFDVISCLDTVLEAKKNKVGRRTYETYEGHINQFKEWLKKNHFQNKPIDQIDKKIINSFLNHISKTKSNRTVNNFKSSLSAIFTLLVHGDYILKNFIVEMDDETITSKRDPTWSEKHVKETDAYLSEHEPVLYMFIHFVAYMFWRPKENCRLQVKDINLEERLITTETKTEGTKTKLIPEILIDELTAYLKGAKPDDYVFTPSGPGPWDRDLDGRRSYFTLKFRRVRKSLNLPSDYTIYGRRHTAITKAYKTLIKDNTKDKTIEILSQITGHTSKAILEYIHYIDAALPEDYSYMLK